MNFKLPLALIGAVLPCLSMAQASGTPRIVVLISVDQFSADLFTQYRPLFSSGLKRLQTGAVFPNAYQSHGATETCPGHSTLLTGSHPARTGIIANEWFDQSLKREDKKVYCSEDPTVEGSSSKHYTVSPQFLKAQTMGDRLKTVNPKSRTIAVAGKDRAVVMMGGHAIDQAWFWSGKAYTTLPTVNSPAPAIVTQVNTRVAASLGKADTPDLPAACKALALPVSVGNGTVGTLKTRAPNDSGKFRATVAFDQATTDIAIGLLRDLKLGTGSSPDLLAIGLSATDYVGHYFGTEGAEMCAQVLGVDANVGRILAALDATHLPYVVALTADHGGHDIPERIRRESIADADRVDDALSPETMGGKLQKEFSLPDVALLGVSASGDIYLNKSVPADLRGRVLEAAKAHYLAHPQVAAVFTAPELRRLPAPTASPDEWSLAERLRASFDPERSGDLIVAPKPHVTPIIKPENLDGYIATHGSPWNYDRRVPLLFFRPGIKGFEQPLPVETVDILPTLASLVGLAIPAAEIDGRCLDLDAEDGSTCKH